MKWNTVNISNDKKKAKTKNTTT